MKSRQGHRSAAVDAVNLSLTARKRTIGHRGMSQHSGYFASLGSRTNLANVTPQPNRNRPARSAPASRAESAQRLGLLTTLQSVPMGIRPVYALGECEIDLGRRELRLLGSPVPFGGRAFGERAGFDYADQYLDRTDPRSFLRGMHVIARSGLRDPQD
jgi:hypothetical protein